ncbi:MAG: hypothetical protein LBE76_07670 [Nitrososphaerota archaeon]|jgi:hypothetical protein|nr:hypothetical protein [Nitrososphaerota archaeon]
MRKQKRCSVLGVSLILVTLLSLLVFPSFAEAKAGYRSEVHSMDGFNWSVSSPDCVKSHYEL